MTVGVEASQIHADLAVVPRDRGGSGEIVQSWEARFSRHRVCQMHKQVVVYYMRWRPDHNFHYRHDY
jgi:hypothetical protein